MLFAQADINIYQYTDRKKQALCFTSTMSAPTFDQAVLNLLRPLPTEESRLASFPTSPGFGSGSCLNFKHLSFPAQVDRVGAAEFEIKISFTGSTPYITIERGRQIVQVENVQYIIGKEIFKLVMKDGQLTGPELIEEKDLPNSISLKEVPSNSDVMQRLEADHRVLNYQDTSVTLQLTNFFKNGGSRFVDPEAPKHMREDLAKFKALEGVIGLFQSTMRRDYVFEFRTVPEASEWFNGINDRAGRLRDVAKSLEIILTHQRGMDGEKGLDDVIDTTFLDLSQERLYNTLQQLWNDYYDSQDKLYWWVIKSLRTTS